MNIEQRLSMLFLRVSMGFVLLIAGLDKVMNPEWTAAGFLNNAQNFQTMYKWFASPANIGWVNFINEWGLTIVGTLLIIGLFVRFAAVGGIVLMILYYLPRAAFPFVDVHIVYIAALIVLIYWEAGQYWGLKK